MVNVMWSMYVLFRQRQQSHDLTSEYGMIQNVYIFVSVLNVLSLF